MVPLRVLVRNHHVKLSVLLDCSWVWPLKCFPAMECRNQRGPTVSFIRTGTSRGSCGGMGAGAL